MFEHLKEVAWAFLLILLFLGCILVIFGRQMGFEPVFYICLGFAVIIGALFMMIVLGELLCLGMIKAFRRFLAEE